MSFYCLDHAEYVHSRRKLSNETLQTLAEYFESIFLGCLSAGLIQKKYNEQLCFAIKCKLHHEPKERYREKLNRLLKCLLYLQIGMYPLAVSDHQKAIPVKCTKLLKEQLVTKESYH